MKDPKIEYTSEVHYHREAFRVLKRQMEILRMIGHDEESLRHMEAATIIYLESQGFYFTKKMKAELVGENYDWKENIK